MQVELQRIDAQAELDDVERRLAEVRARTQGEDEDATWLISECEEGRLLPVRVTVTIRLSVDGADRRVEVVADDVWVVTGWLPFVERQISDGVLEEAPVLSRTLADYRVKLSVEDTYVHVHLDDALVAALGAPSGPSAPG